METETSPELTALHTHIQTLTALYNRTQSLRQIPLLLRPPTAISNGLPAPSHPLHQEFQEIKEINEALRSDKVQEALRTAYESEKTDKSELSSNGRRENRKRRRPPSPESPLPYVADSPQTTSLFPAPEGHPLSLRVDGLPTYIRAYNQAHNSSLHIWSRTRFQPARLSNPVVLRFMIRDVLTAYITMGYSSEDPVLVVETVTVFGPREKKSPHSQSDYLAYQSLSQQLAKMVQSEPLVSLSSLMSLLSSYDGLFVDSCAGCHRVLSLEGHVPPVVRVWVEDRRWEPRHVNCLQN